MATKADLEAFETSVTCPDDFDEFWNGILTHLAGEPLNASATPDPLRSNDDVKVYQASYSSLDGLDIFGWYSVPAVGQGPFSGHPGTSRLQVGARVEARLGRQGSGRAVRRRAGETAQQRAVQPLGIPACCLTE